MTKVKTKKLTVSESVLWSVYYRKVECESEITYGECPGKSLEVVADKISEAAEKALVFLENDDFDDDKEVIILKIYSSGIVHI